MKHHLSLCRKLFPPDLSFAVLGKICYVGTKESTRLDIVAWSLSPRNAHIITLPTHSDVGSQIWPEESCGYTLISAACTVVMLVYPAMLPEVTEETTFLHH